MPAPGPQGVGPHVRWQGQAAERVPDCPEGQRGAQEKRQGGDQHWGHAGPPCLCPPSRWPPPAVWERGSLAYSWNCPLTKRNTRLDFPTADSPSRTSLNWHILLAWGCPLGLAVLLLVMARLSEWERVEGGGCHKAAEGGGGGEGTSRLQQFCKKKSG